MNSSQLISLPSGAEVIAIAPGEALGYRYDAGTIGIISISSLEDDKHWFIRFTKGLKLDFHYFYQKWEPLGRCGSCSHSYPANALKSCERCERPEFCETCLPSHECVIPGIGVSRHPRKQTVINHLRQQKETACR